MRTPEAIFRDEVVDAVDTAGGVASRIESPDVSAGIPDLVLQFGRIDVWAELKVTRSGEVHMRASQRRWHRRRQVAGGKSWLLVKDRTNDDVWAIPGHIAADLQPRAHYWLEAAKLHGHVAPMGMLFSVIEILVHEVLHEQHSSDGHRKTQDPRETGPALQEGGGDVGGHHWLTDKP